jgi:hypothetical protein
MVKVNSKVDSEICEKGIFVFYSLCRAQIQSSFTL